MAGRDRVHPTFYPEISEPVSPSERSTATGYSYQPNFQPTVKAYTTPGFVSPARPPPSVIGRPPRVPEKHRRPRNGCRTCLLASCSILFLFIFAIGLASLVLWLVYKPKIPTYSVRDVHISTLNVTTSSAQSYVNTDILFTILASNPNHKIRIDYKKVNILTTFQGSSVGQSTIPGWFQEPGNSTTIYAHLNAKNAPLSVSQGSALQTQIRGNDVSLHGRIDIKVGIKIGAWKTPGVWIHVDCDFQVSPPSAPSGTKLLSKSCKWSWKG